MESLSGFWAGRYNYAVANAPSVKFDCELTQVGASVTGQITEVDMYKPSGSFLLEAVVDGQIHQQDMSFTKTYITKSDIYDQPVEYVGRVSASGHEISGQWFIGEIHGSFTLTRDKPSSGAAKTRMAANDTYARQSS